MAYFIKNHLGDDDPSQDFRRVPRVMAGLAVLLACPQGFGTVQEEHDSHTD